MEKECKRNGDENGMKVEESKECRCGWQEEKGSQKRSKESFDDMTAHAFESFTAWFHFNSSRMIKRSYSNQIYQ